LVLPSFDTSALRTLRSGFKKRSGQPSTGAKTLFDRKKAVVFAAYYSSIV